MRKLITLIILCISSISFAQDSKAESLLTLLNKNDQKDEARVNLLLKLIDLSNDSIAILKRKQEALSIANELNNPSLKATILRQSAEQLAEFGFTYSALKYIDSAIDIAEQLNLQDQIKNHLVKGRIYQFQLAQYDNSQAAYIKGYELDKTLSLSKRSVDITVSMGNIHWKKGKLEKANEYFKEAIKIGETQNSDISTAILGLGNVLIYQGDFASANDYYLEAYDLMKEIDHPKLIVVLGNISSIYHQLYNHEMCLFYSEKLLKYSKEKDIKRGIFKACNILGNQYRRENEEEKSVPYFKEALKIAYEVNNPIWIVEAHQLLATFFYSIGEMDSLTYHTTNAFAVIDKRNLTDYNTTELHGFLGHTLEKKGLNAKAEYHYLKSFELAEAAGSDRAKVIAQEFLFKFHKNQKEFEKALTYHETYHEIQKNNSRKEQTKQIAEMQTKYETDKKEAENKVLMSTNQFIAKQNQQYKIGAGILTGLLALLGYFFIQLRKTRNQLAAQNQQLKDLNATKDKFFGIIAHDIRSPITALDGVSEQMNYYLEKDDKTKLNRLADRIDTTAKRLTSLLDNLLNWALLQTGMIPYNPKSVNIQTIAQENIDLFNPVAEAKNITLKNNISSTSPVFSDESALQTIIRNLVNNAIKFTPAGGEVSISTEEKGDKIFIKINDTGTGIAADKLEKLFSLEKQSSKGTAGEKGSGLGLMLCKELVELNKGTIQAISELGKGSSFIFSLPRV